MRTNLYLGIMLVMIFIFSVGLWSHPIEQINNWVAKQTENFNTDDVITFLKDRAEGDISYGSEFIFNSNSSYTSATRMDATHFVVAYQDEENSNYGTAILGTITGSTITFGSKYIFNSANSSYISVTSLDAFHFVIAYTDEGNSNYGTTIVGTTTGSSISFGSEYVFNPADTYLTSITSLDTTHFVVAYIDFVSLFTGTAIVGTTTGSSISLGSEYVFNSADTFFPSVTKLDLTHFIIAYSDLGNSNYGTAIVGTTTGLSISFGSEYVFNSAYSNSISITGLDATHFLVAYFDNVSYSGNVIVGSVAGSMITYGAYYVFNNTLTSNISAISLNANRFVVAFRQNYYYGTAIVGTITGSTISFGLQFVFNSASTFYNSAIKLDETHFIVAYQDHGNSNYGTAIVGEIDIDSPLPLTLSSFTAIQTSDNLTQINWITQSENGLNGYNIYRSESNNYNNSTNLNQSLIGPTNSSSTHNYSYTDEDVELEETYYYWLESVELDGNTELFGSISLTLESPELSELPNSTQLKSAYPNPFNPTTTIAFDIKEGETGILTIFNTKGQKVISENFKAGDHEYKWQADKNSSGVYLYKLQTESYSKINKVLMLK